MVAAVLAGSIAGFWVGRATDSQVQVIRQVAAARSVQLRALGVPAAVPAGGRGQARGSVSVRVPVGAQVPAGALPVPLAGLACARPSAPRNLTSVRGRRVLPSAQVPAGPAIFRSVRGKVVLLRPGGRAQRVVMFGPGGRAQRVVMFGPGGPAQRVVMSGPGGPAQKVVMFGPGGGAQKVVMFGPGGGARRVVMLRPAQTRQETPLPGVVCQVAAP